jgi:hypothetical protein
VNGTLKIYAYSLSNSEFLGNDGKIATFQLELGKDPGIFNLTNTKAKMVNVNGEELTLSTVDGIVCIVTPKAEISTPNINYGHIPIRSSYTRSLTVKNTGNAALTIKEILFSDETLSCPSFTEKIVDAGSSTSFSIVYNPIEAGAVSFTVTVVSNAGNGNQKATITADPYSVNELHLDKVSAYCDSVINYNIKINNMDIPLYKEEVIGKIEIKDKQGNTLTSYDLYSKKDILPLSFFDMFLSYLKLLF